MILDFTNPAHSAFVLLVVILIQIVFWSSGYSFGGHGEKASGWNIVPVLMAGVTGVLLVRSILKLIANNW